MSKTSKTTKANSVFLATVLVAGIIALAYPSFMVGAQAQEFNGMDQRYNNYQQDYGQDYGMDSYDKQPYGKDNRYDDHKDSSVTVKKIKCNNINVNLNGDIDIGGESEEVTPMATQALAEDEGANGASGNDRRGGNDDRSSGHDSGSRYVCINNNNNGAEDDGVEEPVPVDECTSCFTDAGISLVFPITVDLPQLDIVIEDFDELCNLIFNPPFSSSLTQLTRLVTEIVPAGTSEGDILEIVNCLADLLGIRGGGGGGGGG